MAFFELLFDVLFEQLAFSLGGILGAEGGGKGLKQGFAAGDYLREADFSACFCVESHAASAIRRVRTSEVGGAVESEAYEMFVGAPPCCDEGVVVVGGELAASGFAVFFAVPIGGADIFRRLFLVPGGEAGRERRASRAFDAKRGIAAVGDEFAVGVVGVGAMVFDEEPRHGDFEGVHLLDVIGVERRARGFFERVLQRRRLYRGGEREAVRHGYEGDEQQRGGEGKGAGNELFHGERSPFQSSG